MPRGRPRTHWPKSVLLTGADFRNEIDRLRNIIDDQERDVTDELNAFNRGAYAACRQALEDFTFHEIIRLHDKIRVQDAEIKQLRLALQGAEKYRGALSEISESESSISAI